MLSILVLWLFVNIKVEQSALVEIQTNGRNRCDADEGEIRSRPPTESARCKTLFFCVFVFYVCVCAFCVLCFVCFVFCVLCLCFVSMFCVYVLCGIVKRWDLLPLNLSPDTKLFPLTADLINSRPEQSILLFGLSVQHGKKRFICAAPQQDTRFSVQLGVYHPPDSKWGCITSNPC